MWFHPRWWIHNEHFFNISFPVSSHVVFSSLLAICKLFYFARVRSSFAKRQNGTCLSCRQVFTSSCEESKAKERRKSRNADCRREIEQNVSSTVELVAYVPKVHPMYSYRSSHVLRDRNVNMPACVGRYWVDAVSSSTRETRILKAITRKDNNLTSHKI